MFSFCSPSYSQPVVIDDGILSENNCCSLQWLASFQKVLCVPYLSLGTDIQLVHKIDQSWCKVYRRHTNIYVCNIVEVTMDGVLRRLVSNSGHCQRNTAYLLPIKIHFQVALHYLNSTTPLHACMNMWQNIVIFGTGTFHKYGHLPKSYLICQLWQMRYDFGRWPYLHFNFFKDVFLIPNSC